MPDIGQEDQTCLPTSTANLIVWFGLHGYPKLIVNGDSNDDNYMHTVHALINATDARYDFGTRTDAIIYGITKYIRDAGYKCNVEYRGIDWSQAKFPDIVKDEDAEKYKAFQTTPVTFSPDWLTQNNDPNKGFILLLAYCKFSEGSNIFTNALNAGHAVTLVNSEPDMLLIHDPAHYGDEPGRKILSTETLTGGSFELPGYNAPVAGLLLLSGSRLEAPPGAVVLLTGAVCVTMEPDTANGSVVAGGAGSPDETVGGTSTSNSTTSSAPPPASDDDSKKSWTLWLFDMLFRK